MRHQVRKSNSGAYSREHMQRAVVSVFNSGLSIRECARINDDIMYMHVGL